ncbi:hypothetical protein [Microbacterium sp. RURRCA19A]|uniref:hypothetical protein n=1 Tax=Microbacterium sp. RURRCA19A TaxID=1907391 RepID=UPI00111559F1|nr:hypothetical protein [Microbacterium sp. RURRCA19A]
MDHRVRGGEWTQGETLTVPTPSSGAPRVDVPVTGAAAGSVTALARTVAPTRGSPAIVGAATPTVRAIVTV